MRATSRQAANGTSRRVLWRGGEKEECPHEWGRPRGHPASKATLRCGDEVHRLRLLQFLGEKPPGWDLGKHPELKDGAAHWVESIRRDEEPTNGEKHRN